MMLSVLAEPSTVITTPEYINLCLVSTALVDPLSRAGLTSCVEIAMPVQEP